MINFENIYGQKEAKKPHFWVTKKNHVQIYRALVRKVSKEYRITIQRSKVCVLFYWFNISFWYLSKNKY